VVRVAGQTPLDAAEWRFRPVWTLLYAMMAIAAWLVWTRVQAGKRAVPLALFFIQLGLNTLWSVCFFGLRNPTLGFAEICVLWAAIVATTVAFYRKKRAAGILLIPYLVWVSFAAALNFAIMRLNG